MMKRGHSWRVAVRWLWVAAAAWAVYGLLLYGHARHVLGSCAFNPAPYRDHLFRVDAQRTAHAHAFLSQLSAVKPPTAALDGAPATQPSASLRVRTRSSVVCVVCSHTRVRCVVSLVVSCRWSCRVQRRGRSCAW
jgi:hypothetical protein